MISQIPRHQCDRCGLVEECRQHDQADAWGKILASEANGPFRIGEITHKLVSPAGGKDICPRCIKELSVWWGAA
jgi:hypothetical protein